MYNPWGCRVVLMSCAARVASMDNPWGVHGQFVGGSWTAHGVFMGSQ